MNLWSAFPEALLHIEGILYLPYLAIPFYFYVLYALVKQPAHRVMLALFLGLSAIASLVMFFSLGPGIGSVIPPLLLLSVMLMPLATLIVQKFGKHSNGIRLWSVVSVAGWLHSLSWAVWLMALAGS